MRCSICGRKEAVVFVHQFSRGERRDLRLCASCASSHGLGDLEGDLSVPLGKLLAEDAEQPAPAEPACPRCALTAAEALRKGAAGCPDCWNALGGELEPAAGRPPYRGRLPRRLQLQRAERDRLDALRSRLGTALAAEDYESAALLRDELKALEPGGADA